MSGKKGNEVGNENFHGRIFHSKNKKLFPISHLLLLNFLVRKMKYLNFLLHVLNRIRALDFESDGFASESLDEDLHCKNASTTSPKKEQKRRFFCAVEERTKKKNDMNCW